MISVRIQVIIQLAFLLLATLTVSGCGSLVPIRDLSNLSASQREKMTEISVYQVSELKADTYKTIGEKVVGYSCRLDTSKPPASRSDALDQLRIKALEAGVNAVVLDSCVPEGTSYSKNCWDSFTCTGSLASIEAGSVLASARKPTQLATILDNSFPLKPLAINFKASKPRPNDIAVIIGNADYKKQGTDIPNVTPAYADAASFRRYAVEALGIREGNIIDLQDATGSQLIRVFGSERTHKGQLFDWVRPGLSNVFVYYAGHGAPSGEEGSAYIIPSDADGARIDLNGYMLSTLYDNLGKIPAKSITVVLEACFSGASESGTVIANASPVFIKAKTPPVPKNITVISAGTTTQMASWEKDKSHGLFSKYFLTGMSGEADAKPYGNADGKVDYSELDAYLEDTLTYYARRHYGRDQTAQIVIGKSN